MNREQQRAVFRDLSELEGMQTGAEFALEYCDPEPSRDHAQSASLSVSRAIIRSSPNSNGSLSDDCPNARGTSSVAQLMEKPWRSMSQISRRRSSDRSRPRDDPSPVLSADLGSSATPSGHAV